jgi:hypothetical protein
MFPYSVDELYAMYAAYNQALGVWQVVAYLPAIAAVIFAIVGKKSAGVWISLFLGLLWIWVGLVYHLMFFAEINTPAYYYAAGFVVQGILILWAGVKEKNLQYQFQPTLCGITAAGFLLYALVGYPLLCLWLGRGYPAVPAFWLAPAPITIFTFGMLLWTVKRVPEYLFLIPILWSLVGSLVASMGIVQELGLLIAGIISALMVHRHNRVTKRVI